MSVWLLAQYAYTYTSKGQGDKRRLLKAMFFWISSMKEKIYIHTILQFRIYDWERTSMLSGFFAIRSKYWIWNAADKIFGLRWLNWHEFRRNVSYVKFTRSTLLFTSLFIQWISIKVLIQNTVRQRRLIENEAFSMRTTSKYSGTIVNETVNYPMSTHHNHFFLNYI